MHQIIRISLQFSPFKKAIGHRYLSGFYSVKTFGPSDCPSENVNCRNEHTRAHRIICKDFYHCVVDKSRKSKMACRSETRRLVKSAVIHHPVSYWMAIWSDFQRTAMMVNPCCFLRGWRWGMGERAALRMALSFLVQAIWCGCWWHNWDGARLCEQQTPGRGDIRSSAWTSWVWFAGFTFQALLGEVKQTGAGGAERAELLHCVARAQVMLGLMLLPQDRCALEFRIIGILAK